MRADNRFSPLRVGVTKERVPFLILAPTFRTERPVLMPPTGPISLSLLIRCLFFSGDETSTRLDPTPNSRSDRACNTISPHHSDTDGDASGILDHDLLDFLPIADISLSRCHKRFLPPPLPPAMTNAFNNRPKLNVRLNLLLTS